MHDLDHFISEFSNLNTTKIKGFSTPNKAVLLLAVIELIGEGKITSPQIALTEVLKDRFNQIWDRFVQKFNVFTPDIESTFFALQHESFWANEEDPSDFTTAEIEDDLFELLKKKDGVRHALSGLLMSTYLYPLMLDPQEIMIQSGTDECPFCHMDDSIKVILEVDAAVAIYDANPVSPGHALIVPKRHVASYFDLTDYELTAMNRLLKYVKVELDAKYHPDGYNIGVNVNEEAGQSIFHCHMHVIPRYKGDMANPKGGVRGVIPEKQKY
ncbi:MAG: HIT family protein [Bacteroidaceae bacterium]|nr:HIT family protein [Bacteroidaceae bacterium]